MSQARNQRENGWLSLSPSFTLVSCLIYYLTLKMEATCSSEKLANFITPTFHESKLQMKVFSSKNGSLQKKLLCIVGLKGKAH
jgi:hypothetical protein